MTDLDHHFGSLDLLEPTDLTEEIQRRAPLPEPAPLPERPRRRVAAGLVAAAVFIAVAVFAWSAFVPAERKSSIGPRPDGTPTPVGAVDPLAWPGVEAGLVELAAPPSVRWGGTSVWTGSELIHWGGTQGIDPPHSADGVIFDARSLEWRHLAPGPLSARSWAVGVWTGGDVIIWGGATGSWPAEEPVADGAAFDPATESWRSIARAPFALVGPEAVWTGTEMLVVGSEGRALSYDPAADTWRLLPDAPVELSELDAVWTGREMIAFGAAVGAGGQSQPPTIGAAFDPSENRWRTIESPALSPYAVAATWAGTEMVAVDYELAASSLDPVLNQWHRLPRLPTNACEGYPEIAGAGTTVLASLCGETVMLSLGQDRWHVILGRGEAAGGRWGYFDPITTGDRFLLLGLGTGGDRTFVYTPIEDEGSPRARDAWDVAAAFAALRSHYPYDQGEVPIDVSNELEGLIAVDVLERWDAKGMAPLWSYYPGFEVSSVDRAADQADVFEVVVRLDAYRGPAAIEKLLIGPGVGADGEQHDLVIIGAEPLSRG